MASQDRAKHSTHAQMRRGTVGRDKITSRGTSQMLFAAIGGTVIAAMAGVLIATDRSGSRAQPSVKILNRQIEHRITTLLNGIPQHGDALGQPTAPVTVQIFGDLECSTVKLYVLTYLPAIIDDFVRSNVIRIEYRSFKTDTHAAGAFVNQQIAALASGAQDKLWNFIETFYHEQGREYSGYATERYIDSIAGQVPGLDLARWRSDREEVAFLKRVIGDDHTARTLGFHDTPAFRIGRTGGRMKTLTGRYIIRFRNERNPLSLVDAQDVKNAIDHLP